LGFFGKCGGGQAQRSSKRNTSRKHFMKSHIHFLLFVQTECSVYPITQGLNSSLSAYTSTSGQTSRHLSERTDKLVPFYVSKMQHKRHPPTG
jgi:hypothetical protein